MQILLNEASRVIAPQHASSFATKGGGGRGKAIAPFYCAAISHRVGFQFSTIAFRIYPLFRAVAVTNSRAALS